MSVFDVRVTFMPNPDPNPYVRLFLLCSTLNRSFYYILRSIYIYTIPKRRQQWVSQYVVNIHLFSELRTSCLFIVHKAYWLLSHLYLVFMIKVICERYLPSQRGKETVDNSDQGRPWSTLASSELRDISDSTVRWTNVYAIGFRREIRTRVLDYVESQGVTVVNSSYRWIMGYQPKQFVTGISHVQPVVFADRSMKSHIRYYLVARKDEFRRNPNPPSPSWCVDFPMTLRRNRSCFANPTISPRWWNTDYRQNITALQ